jgi:hypothetical protein
MGAAGSNSSRNRTDIEAVTSSYSSDDRWTLAKPYNGPLLRTPQGLAHDNRTNRTFVADLNNERIAVIDHANATVATFSHMPGVRDVLVLPEAFRPAGWYLAFSTSTRWGFVSRDGAMASPVEAIPGCGLMWTLTFNAVGGLLYAGAQPVWHLARSQGDSNLDDGDDGQEHYVGDGDKIVCVSPKIHLPSVVVCPRQQQSLVSRAINDVDYKDNYTRGVVHDRVAGVLYVAYIDQVRMLLTSGKNRWQVRTLATFANANLAGIALVIPSPDQVQDALLRSLQSSKPLSTWPPGLVDVIECYARRTGAATSVLVSDEATHCIFRIKT